MTLCETQFIYYSEIALALYWKYVKVVIVTPIVSTRHIGGFLQHSNTYRNE